MRELTSIELQAVSGGATAVEYGLIAALVAVAATPAASAPPFSQQ
jgi:hypothetical protein